MNKKTEKYSNSQIQAQPNAGIKESSEKLEKVLKLSSDELIASAIRDILKRDESSLYH